MLPATAFIGSSGCERAKRVVCLANLRQLTAAWNIYADDNGGKIVNGYPNGTPGSADPGIGIHEGEIPWVGRCWHDSYFLGEPLPTGLQENAIKLGVLWPYCRRLRLYRCPSGIRENFLTYTIVDGMNGMQRSGTGVPGVFIKTKAEIENPQARIVFLDEGWATPGSFATHYNKEHWWDDPVARHGDGVPLSFADGHTGYRLWKGDETTQMARSRETPPTSIPITPEGREDLHGFQIGVWGSLGYDPY